MYKLTFIHISRLRFWINRLFSAVVDFIEDHQLSGGNLVLPNAFVQQVMNHKIEDPVLRKTINKIIAKHKRDFKKHFEKDGWNLDAHSCVSDVLYDFHKIHIEEYIKAKLIKGLPVDIRYKGHKDYFVKNQ